MSDSLESRQSKSGCWLIPVQLRSLFLTHPWLFSCFSSHGRERERASSLVSPSKSTNLIVRTLASWSHLCRLLPESYISKCYHIGGSDLNVWISRDTVQPIAITKGQCLEKCSYSTVHAVSLWILALSESCENRLTPVPKSQIKLPEYHSAQFILS